MTNPNSNKELQKLAREAIENWLFDADTDPDGAIKEGLEYYASDGDVCPDEEIPSLFEGWSSHMDKWDILEEMARGVGRG